MAPVAAKRTESSMPLDRTAVIELAGDLLDQRGIEVFRLGDVAAMAGVTQPALYRHIAGAADLWRGLSLATRDDLVRCLTEASAGRSGEAAVRAVAQAWRRYARDHPGRYRSTERAPVRGDAELEAAVERVKAALGAALRGFDLAPQGVDHATVMFRSALHGFVSFELSDGNVHAPDDTFQHLVDMLCVGFRALANGVQPDVGSPSTQPSSS